MGTFSKNIKNNKNDENDSDDICLYCNELYSKSIDVWIKWTRNLCGGNNEEDSDVMFVCDLVHNNFFNVFNILYFSSM